MATATSTLDKNSPDSTSSDYDAMLPFWNKVDTIVEGRDAIIEAGQEYLPKFVDEDDDDYNERLSLAKFTNLYRDIIENLAGKPFTEELQMAQGTPEPIEKLAEDIDGKGNNIHVFASQVFFAGINSGIDWILVDYSKKPNDELSLADEQRLGLRPYWVRVPAKRMLMVVTDRIGAREEVVYARILEKQKRRKGYGEELIVRIRIFERPEIPIIDPNTGTQTGVSYGPARFQVLEAREEVIGARRTVGTRKAINWVQVDAGPITIGVIPLIPFLTGRRRGSSWVIDAPMKDAADLQIEHYQAESNLKFAKVYTAFPLLNGFGFSPEIDPKTKQPKKLRRSPNGILYSPAAKMEGQSTGWQFLEISATSLNFLQKDVEAIERQMREVGRQPLTSNVANMTAATAGGAAQKSNSAVQDWAFKLKDAIERAFIYTAMWINMTVEPEITIYTDFNILDEDSSTPAHLVSIRKNKDLSQKTLWNEFKRRGILSGDFDPDAEEKALEEEEPSPEDIDEQRAAMGLPPLSAAQNDPNNPADPNAPPSTVPGAKKPAVPPKPEEE